MTAANSTVSFTGGNNQGFQLGNNSGRVDVSYRISQSGEFFCTLSLETVLISVCPGQRKRLNLVPVPPYHFGEITTLSIATRLLRSTHGVLNRPLEWHLLGWEALGKDKP